MPFKSKAQQKWMFAAEARGEIKKGTAERWAKHTKNIKKLPKKLGKKKTKKSTKAGMHRMPNGKMMSDKAMAKMMKKTYQV